MLETPHVAVGAAIATKVVNPVLAIPLAFASHFILDKIPHWNPSFYTETKKGGKPAKKSIYFSVAESFLALGIGSFLAIRQLPNYGFALTIFAASFASVASDVVKIPYFFFGKHDGLIKKWVEFERSLQVETDNFYLGMATQILLVVIALWWTLH
jgi:hypothetical protein